MAGVEPTLVRCVVPDDHLSQYVISKNIMRRHMEFDQRVGLVLALRPVLAEQAKERQVQAGKESGRGMEKVTAPVREAIGESAEQAAKLCHVGARSVEKAIAVEKDDPEIAVKLMGGRKTIGGSWRVSCAATIGRRVLQRQRQSQRCTGGL